MKTRRLALMVFYDDKNRILLQDRSNMSKWGEGWGYFGGSIDESESPKDAVIREIQEELKFKVHEQKYLGQYISFGKLLKDPSKEIKVVQEVFFMKITEKDCQKMVLCEGAGKKWFSIHDAKNLKMYPLDPQILDNIKKKSNNLNRLQLLFSVMKTRRVALIIFYDKNKILLQDREGISKIGAKIGYFGGGIEQGETPEQAVVRETKEELDLDLIDHKFIGIFENQVTPELYVIRYVFIAPLKDKLSKITLREGKRMFLMTLDEAAKVKSVKGDDLVLKKLKEIIQ